MLNYAVKGHPGVLRHHRMAMDAGADFLLCPVVEFEIVRYLRLRGMPVFERALYEFMTGWRRSAFDQELLDRALPLWVERHKVGRPIEDADLLIAVSAIREAATLVTNNVRRFGGLGLALENWAA
jgi:predicted nucleic acid-binding protein